MRTLPAALAPMAQYRQFILYKLIWDETKQKFQKIPVSPFTRQPFPKKSDWQKDPSQMCDFETAAANVVDGYGVGFLFTDKDPFFFADLDNCLLPDGSDWSPLAKEIIRILPGAAIEVSASGKGLHIFGTGTVPPKHSNRNESLGLEFYTQWRFVALTGTHAAGDASTDCTATLSHLVNTYFPERVSAAKGVEWSSEAVAEWAGPEDDDELIETMLACQSKNATNIFGGQSNLQALWSGDADALGKFYPDSSRTFDESQADAGLAQHLAYWTGNNCDRIFTMMWRSGLVRDKWQREDYLQRTILRAVALQNKFYQAIDTSLVDKYGAGKIDASSAAQREFAEKIRASVVATASEEVAAYLCQTRTSAKFWLDNQGKSADELHAMLQPVKTVAPEYSAEPEIVSGFQYLGATLQIEKFEGCTYIQDVHRILTPRGTMLDPGQFRAVHGGYSFQMDDMGERVTRNAWEAFTESQLVRFPKADTTCFRPDFKPGAIIDVEGLKAVNAYKEVETPRQKGDLAPFMRHLEKLLPDARDREIIISFMAAIVQYKGVKFQWCPLVQGAPGNGKTLLTRCVAFAVSNRYSHLPKADEIGNKFNGWLINKLFIGVEDVYIPENKKELIETLKPMITNERQEIQFKGSDQVTKDICANFILNSNHKDAIRKTRDDRRFAVFFTAQQSEEDIRRDGMGGDYFPSLYAWLQKEGYAIVNEFLSSYKIKDEFNPATSCHRAPETSSTLEALSVGMGSVEQEILEAIQEDRIGFSGGWVSSVAMERLLKEMRVERMIPPNKRRDLMISLGYDWHPALHNGRVNNPILLDDNKKPRLYIKKGHLALQQNSPAEVARMYEEAQRDPDTATPSKVFGAAK